MLKQQTWWICSWWNIICGFNEDTMCRHDTLCVQFDAKVKNSRAVYWGRAKYNSEKNHLIFLQIVVCSSSSWRELIYRQLFLGWRFLIEPPDETVKKMAKNHFLGLSSTNSNVRESNGQRYRYYAFWCAFRLLWQNNLTTSWPTVGSVKGVTSIFPKIHPFWGFEVPPTILSVHF